MINTACLHPNQGDLIIGDQDGYIRIWDLTKDQARVLPERLAPIRSLTIASDATSLVAATHLGMCYLYKPKKGDDNDTGAQWELMLKWAAHDKYVLKALLSSDCKLLATCSADKNIKIWKIDDINPGKPYKVLKGHQRWVWDIAFSADGAYLVSASSDKTAKLWALETEKAVLEYK